MHLIYIFLLYFGKNFNSFFQLYLDSVQFNTDILRIILVTDISDIQKYILPSNLILYNISLNDIRLRVSNIMHRDLNTTILPTDIIKTPYKLCDFRLLYPVIFEDIILVNNISEMDYIGWGDCDQVFGKITNLIDLSQKNYSMIGSHGSFTVFRNIPIFKNIYKKLDVNLLIDHKNRQLDENKYTQSLFRQAVSQSMYEGFDIAPITADIQPWQWKYKHLSEEHSLRVLFGRRIGIITADFFLLDYIHQRLLMYYTDNIILYNQTTTVSDIRNSSKITDENTVESTNISSFQQDQRQTTTTTAVLFSKEVLYAHFQIRKMHIIPSQETYFSADVTVPGRVNRASGRPERNESEANRTKYMSTSYMIDSNNVSMNRHHQDQHQDQDQDQSQRKHCFNYIITNTSFIEYLMPSCDMTKDEMSTSMMTEIFASVAFMYRHHNSYYHRHHSSSR